MLEQYTNSASTTLVDGITDIATSLTVASAADFPTVGQYRIIIDSEILLVTAVALGVFSVTRGVEGSLAGSHLAGAEVIHILTERSLDSIARGNTGYFDITTDARADHFTVFGVTTNATQTQIYISGETNQRYTIPNHHTAVFRSLIVAKRIDATNEAMAKEVKGCLENDGATTSLVNTNTTTSIVDDSFGAWGVSIEADNANSALIFKVTGQVSKTIRWVIYTEIVQVGGNTSVPS